MKNTHTLPWLLLIPAVLLGAAPGMNVAEMLRKGDEAFHNQQFQEAIDWYQKAGERGTDPGLTAYNEAVAHYQLGHYRDAELCFRNCLEDATAGRRVQGLFGLANALLMQAGKTDVALLKDAIRCYQLCRQEGDLSAGMTTDVDHNLELARLLLAQAIVEAAKQPPGPEGSDPPKDNKTKGSEPGSQDPKGVNPSDPDGSDPGKGADQQKDNLDPKEAQGSITVRGKPPVIPDEGKLVPIPAEDTAAYLQQVTERIWQESQQAQSSKHGSVAGVKDW